MYCDFMYVRVCVNVGAKLCVGMCDCVQLRVNVRLCECENVFMHMSV